MARKRDFKAEYQRRLERGRAKGLTRQQARGHKLHEHIERAEREIEQNEGLTNAQIRTVFNWASDRFFTIHDTEMEPIETVEWAKANGYDAFKVYRARWDFIRRRFLRESKAGKWTSRGIGWLMGESEEVGVPDVSWLYYH